MYRVVLLGMFALCISVVSLTVNTHVSIVLIQPGILEQPHWETHHRQPRYFVLLHLVRIVDNHGILFCYTWYAS